MLNGRPAGRSAWTFRVARVNRAYVLLALLLVLGAVLYLYHDFGYFLHDDEGGYAYATWRVSLGELPYRDFLTPQMPAFLYWGGLLVRLFGRSLVVLRLLGSMIMVLLAAGLLYAANREVFGPSVALLSTALFLVEPDACHNARLFRPEALMLVFQMAALYAFILGEKRGCLGWYALAGAMFGLSALSKLFGFLPPVGCLIYLFYAWWREHRSFRRTLRQGLALGGVFLVVVGVTALAFTLTTHRFFGAVIGHHTAQGAGMALADRVTKALVLYRDYVLAQPVALGLAVLGAWLALRRKQALASLQVWSVPTIVVFLGVSRGLQLRHLAYLAPALATFAAVAVVQLLAVRARLPRRGWRSWCAVALLAAGLLVAACYPWLAADAIDVAKEEVDSAYLSALIQRLAPSDQLVISDYPGLAFLAGRGSTYWGSGLSGGATRGGQIRGIQLAEEIERQDVAVIAMLTRGGADHMVAMADYPDFIRYVQSRYSLVEEYVCGYQGKVFKIYARCDLLPAGCEANPAPLATFFGGLIELRLPGCPEGVWQSLWTVVQWQDGTGAWHDVEGWQGPLAATREGVAHSMWKVDPGDLGKGPFRWVVLSGRGGEMLAASQPFQLPSRSGDWSQTELHLNP